MKNLGFLLLAVIYLVSCHSDKVIYNTDLVNNWKATEWLNDPGDGSGVFTPIPSGNNYYLRFKGNGDFEGNYIFIAPSQFNKYKIVDSSNIVLYKQNTTDSARIIYNFANNNQELLVSFMCIEPCRLKLIRD